MHGSGEVGNVVVPVPYAFALGKIVAYRVEGAYVVGVDIVGYIVLAHLYALALHLKCDASS